MNFNYWYVCGVCAHEGKRRFSTRGPDRFIDGHLAKLIRTASTRPKKCEDCGKRFKDIYRMATR